MTSSAQVARLIDDLASPDAQVRQRGAEQLARAGDQARPAAVALVRCCADTEEVRNWATAALEDLGPPDPSHVAALTVLTVDPCADVAYWAVTLLSRLKSDAATAVPALTHLLESHVDLALRQRAAWALGQIGPSAVAALGALQSAASGDNHRLASVASDSIGLING